MRQARLRRIELRLRGVEFGRLRAGLHLGKLRLGAEVSGTRLRNGTLGSGVIQPDEQRAGGHEVAHRDGNFDDAAGGRYAQ